VPAFGGIKLAKRLDGTPPERQVEDIAMAKCPNVGPEIERGAKKDGVPKGPTQVRIAPVQGSVVAAVVLIQSRGPEGEGRWGVGENASRGTGMGDEPSAKPARRFTFPLASSPSARLLYSLLFSHPGVFCPFPYESPTLITA
jgi:hypothetical protein